MKSLSLFIAIIAIFFLNACKENPIPKVDFLTGIWKIENEEQFEVWEKYDNNELKGYSFKIINNKEHILETLSIQLDENKIIYSATVPNQNNGETIAFELNNDVKDLLSFENPGHDFPKKIQYKKITSNEVFVKVSGDDNDGFSYTMFKQ